MRKSNLLFVWTFGLADRLTLPRKSLPPAFCSLNKDAHANPRWLTCELPACASSRRLTGRDLNAQAPDSSARHIRLGHNSNVTWRSSTRLTAALASPLSSQNLQALWERLQVLPRTQIQLIQDDAGESREHGPSEHRCHVWRRLHRCVVYSSKQPHL